MRLQNLIFNKIGNNFSVMIGNPEIKIMENISSPINIDNNSFYFEIEGISTINHNNTILKIFIKLHLQQYSYPISISFFNNGDITLETKEKFKGSFLNGLYTFEFLEEEPMSIFKLSAYKAKEFEIIKEDKYKIKIKENSLIKGALELVYILR